MTAVALTRRLILEALVSQPDGAGGFTRSWIGLGTLWGEVVAGTGREIAAQASVVSVTQYRIVVRAAPPGSAARPKPDQRFRDGQRVFVILAVAERDADARYLICTACEEVAA